MKIRFLFIANHHDYFDCSNLDYHKRITRKKSTFYKKLKKILQYISEKLVQWLNEKLFGSKLRKLKFSFKVSSANHGEYTFIFFNPFMMTVLI